MSWIGLVLTFEYFLEVNMEQRLRVFENLRRTFGPKVTGYRECR